MQSSVNFQYLPRRRRERVSVRLISMRFRFISIEQPVITPITIISGIRSLLLYTCSYRRMGRFCDPWSKLSHISLQIAGIFFFSPYRPWISRFHADPVGLSHLLLSLSPTRSQRPRSIAPYGLRDVKQATHFDLTDSSLNSHVVRDRIPSPSYSKTTHWPLDHHLSHNDNGMK
ncbi:hypothetical protein EVAR_49635_1 [Eumeta japonica]|uniref:Uncharacterized protein n=1 Tax=Eumeta variegata TaxID=151549 RepID=A0A4C1Y744_EUMVA|nr:hypothetical protein EVAR_49635_1 [Eumeta japonica]